MATAAERAAKLSKIKANLFTSQDSATAPSRIPIIDSHIHLYPHSELENLAWLSPSAPTELQGQHSVSDYLSDTDAPLELEGFIFLETDRKNDLVKGEEDGSGWEGPLMEVEWLMRIATGLPREGEGHVTEHKKLCLGIIPWAPIPSGEVVMTRYLQTVKEKAGDSWSKIRGFRYLCQDKPDEIMLEDKFIESLKFLGRNGFVFDLGVDMHRRGEGQLVEAVKMIEKSHEDVPVSERVKFIINHLCKPDLTIAGDRSSNPTFLAWRTQISELSRLPNTYMKLSGMFSELPESLQTAPKEEIFEHIMPWLIVVLTTFKGRLMFGSDWPVCTAGIGSEAWAKWKWIVGRMCVLAEFSVEQEVMLWSGTAIEAYGIKELM